MKKYWKVVLALSFLLCAAGAFSACGESAVGIQETYLNDKGELIIVLTDGTVNNLGPVKGTDGANGTDGTDGTNGANGNNGTNGSNGTNGTDGKSAYELYCAAHSEYKGTEAEWLQALVNGTLIEKSHFHEYTAEETGALCDSSGYTTYSCECGDYYTVRHSMRHLLINDACIYCGNGWNDLDLSYLDIYNSTYGYHALGETEHGEGKQALYLAIDKKVRIFHENSALDAEESDGDFVAASVNFSELGINVEEAASVWKTYLDDNPLYYWLAKSMGHNGSELYLYTEEQFANGTERAETNREIYQAIKEYTKGGMKETSAYQTALYYHDSIIGAIDYAYEEDGKTPQTAYWAHSILGVFTEQGAVCEGYARSFQILLNVSGVENIFVTGTGNSEAHAWNLVRLDNGGWYWCDLTWDDTPTFTFGFQHRYFCVNDTENINLWDDNETYPERTFLYNHTPDPSTGTGVNYFYDLPARAEAAHGEKYLRSTFTVNKCTYAITGYNSVQLIKADAANVTVPETVSYKGRTYTVLSIGGMDENKSFGTIRCEEAISDEVKRISIPASVRFIFESSFRTNYLENIEVAEGNAVYTSVNGVLYTKSLYTLIRYPSAKPDTAFTIPDETRHIAHFAFESMSYLETLTIGKSVEVVGDTVWRDGNYPNGENISGEIQVTYIIRGDWYKIVSGMKNFKSIAIDPENPYFCDHEGALYDKELTMLWVVFPNAKHFVMPDSVTGIESSVFEHSAIESVVLSENLERIGAYVFLDCRSLKSVTVPVGITKFGDGMFALCPNLTEIRYKGTVAQWQAIEKPEDDGDPYKGIDGWDEDTDNYVVYCTDGTVQKDGRVTYYK